MSSTTITHPAAAGRSEVELLIGGMTRASCAARVEKKLNRMDGVTATVNHATEKARISYGAGVEVADLISAVVKTGYTAEEPAPPATTPATASAPASTGTPAEASGDRELSALRHRLLVCALLATPVVLTAMVPVLSSTTGSGCS